MVSFIYARRLTRDVIEFNAWASVVWRCIIIAGGGCLITGVIIGIVARIIIIGRLSDIVGFGSLNIRLLLQLACSHYFAVVLFILESDWVPRFSIRLLFGSLFLLGSSSDLLYSFLALRALKLFILLRDKLMEYLRKAVWRGISQTVLPWFLNQKSVG